jgi:hypothetical protein
MILETLYKSHNDIDVRWYSQFATGSTAAEDKSVTVDDGGHRVLAYHDRRAPESAMVGGQNTKDDSGWESHFKFCYFTNKVIKFFSFL